LGEFTVTIFDALVWAGTAITLFGLGLLIFCIVKVMRLRKVAGSDEEIRAAMQKVIPMNLGALALSALGLMCVTMGIFLS
jgi:hypothetical protein